MTPQPRWISEAEAAELLDLHDAIEILETGLQRQADGHAQNMAKTHVTWGAGDTLHAIGAVFEDVKIVGAKTWAHTQGGATPLMLLWSADEGRLLAVIEAFALGQMRTGGISGVATRAMAAPHAATFALLGAGKQAMAQLAAVAAVRPLREVRVWSRAAARRDAFLEAADAMGWDFALRPADTAEAAADGADIVTLVTRAKQAFFRSEFCGPHTHVNAVGAITPERQEFEPELLARASLVAADDPQTALRLSREFSLYFRAEPGREAGLQRLCDLIARLASARPAGVSLFKAMGMGISDLALAAEIYARALSRDAGKTLEHPKRATMRLKSPQSEPEPTP